MCKLLWLVGLFDLAAESWIIAILLLLQPFYSRLSGTTWVSRYQYQKKHSFAHLSWSSSSLYQLLWFTTIHSILSVQITCLTIFLHNLLSSLSSTSWHEVYIMRYWHGYLLGVRCKWFAYDPADATATPSSLASLKSWSSKIQIGFTFLVPAYPCCA